MPADADKRTYVIFRFWLCSHKPSLPTKEKIISRALAHPVGLLRKLHCEPAAWIVHKSFPPQRMSKVGGCRTFESVSLLSIGKARSADKILAWAVRPRECEKRRIALKVRRRSLRSIPRTISANWLQHRTLLHAPYLSSLPILDFHRAFSAGPLRGRFPGPNSPGYNRVSASRLSYTCRPSPGLNLLRNPTDSLGYGSTLSQPAISAWRNTYFSAEDLSEMAWASVTNIESYLDYAPVGLPQQTAGLLQS
jgi:hypothetical protein